MPAHIPDCGYPGCTGVHDSARPIAEWCPRTRAERQAYARAYERDYVRKRDPERTRAQAARRQRRYREKHPDRVFAGALWAKYRITPKERTELFEASDGLCALCYEHPATQIDHDHVTGAVRGAVCPTCNKGLWFYESRGADVIQHYLDTVSTVTPS
jgi:hypothetical protein